MSLMGEVLIKGADAKARIVRSYITTAGERRVVLGLDPDQKDALKTHGLGGDHGDDYSEYEVEKR